jgi:hypothetical protein
VLPPAGTSVEFSFAGKWLSILRDLAPGIASERRQQCRVGMPKHCNPLRNAAKLTTEWQRWVDGVEKVVRDYRRIMIPSR